MNAAGQRRLTPWLLAACLVLAAAWVVLLVGIGRSVHWNPPMSPRPLPPMHHAVTHAAGPLEQYADIWQHPLFTATRKPAQPATADQGKNTRLDNLALTGIILAPGVHMALLSDRHDGHAVRVREGALLAHSAWKLLSLQPRSAVFVDGGQRKRLDLTVPGNTGTTSPATATRKVPQQIGAQAPKPAHPASEASGTATQRARIQAIRQRIEQRRREQATHAGDH